MPVEAVAPQWVFSCDCCGVKETRRSSNPPVEWIGININQSAVDWQGSPCADASVKLLLCRGCGTKATAAINEAFASARKKVQS